MRAQQSRVKIMFSD